MAAIVTGCLGAVGGKVGELILRQFNYLYCFGDNITNLENEAENLKVLERDLQGKVQAARDDVRVITDEVETWLKNSNKIKDEINGILNEVPNVGCGCFGLGARFSLSKRAEDTAGRVKKLLGEYKFNTDAICRPRSPAATKVVPLKRTYEFESRIQIEGEIMETLRGEDVKMMGICGMGGLGKTTMAKRIMNRALEEHVFEGVVMAVVSRPVEELKIQLEIGRSLNLNLDGESSQGRVQKLHERLSGPKRTLVILDDVWEILELEDLGIPHSYEGCTIILTSRSRDVLSGMNVQNIFGMELLSEEDSWFLFKEKVGSHEDDTELNSIAKEVVNECGRLPIALITVGSALKDKVNVITWKNALRQLKRHDPDIPDFIKKVYNPLELSYDVLEHKYKLVFLLCCLYPEDADIPLERLTYFCMGLRLFEGGIVEERERMHSLIDVLKDRSLLLDSNRGDDYVRMHDVVRDVCIYIARKNKYISGGDSSLQRYEFDPGYTLLQIRNSDEEINFDGISDLYVLSIEWCSQLTSLPLTQRPNNLITLVLESCRRLETLSVVGELVNLEILICRDCDSIEELPPEIKGLNRLKVLDLTRCVNLQRIGRGIISSLEGLEELKMWDSFDKWEAEDREGRENAGLGELATLNKLRYLELDFENVDRFTIRVLCGSFIQSIPYVEFPSLRQVTTYNCPNMKNFTLGSLGAPNLISFNTDFKDDLLQVPFISQKQLWIKGNEKPLNYFQIHGSVFDRLEELHISWYKGSMSLFSSSITGNLVNLTRLDIQSCDKMVKVIEEKEEEKEKVVSGAQRTTILFPKLQKIVLSNLPALVRFCEWKCHVELPSLTEVEILLCDNMKRFTLGHLNTPNLEMVKIDLEEFGEVKDLNGLVQQRRAEEEEDDDVDDENREEQN